MSPPRIAVIGGGVGACSLAHGLRDCVASGAVALHLFEMGRGTGGRAATRITRDKPDLRVDHGVPSFSVYTTSFRTICDSLVEANILQRCDGRQFGSIRSDGSFEAEEAKDAPMRYRAAEGKGMNTLCDALLRGKDGVPQVVETTLGTMVSGLEPIRTDAQPVRWRLTSKTGADLGVFDWLVVTSTGVAHPRWRAAFGGEPPLVEAAASLHDAPLDATLAALAPLTAKPVTAALLAYEGDAADAWAALPFYKARVEADETLSRVVVQRLSPRLTSVVLHSTHAFSLQASHVYGATSSAARIAGARSDAGEEAAILEAMVTAAERRLGPLFGGDAAAAAAVRTAAWGPLLHRWGSAFPDAPLLPEVMALVPSARVAFCGDFVAGPADGVPAAGGTDAAHGVGGRAGSVEGAALSGMRLAEALRHEILGGAAGDSKL